MVESWCYWRLAWWRKSSPSPYIPLGAGNPRSSTSFISTHPWMIVLTCMADQSRFDIPRPKKFLLASDDCLLLCIFLWNTWMFHPSDLRCLDWLVVVTSSMMFPILASGARVYNCAIHYRWLCQSCTLNLLVISEVLFSCCGEWLFYSWFRSLQHPFWVAIDRFQTTYIVDNYTAL